MGIGVVTSPFGGVILIAIGDSISKAGTIIQISVDLSEQNYDAAIIKTISSTAPGLLSKPLRNLISKHFGKVASEAFEKNDFIELEMHLKGNQIIQSKVNVLEYSTGKAIESNINKNEEE